ncbi:uncharacterized protein AKAW2_20982A [Aspergillus luchuensis]|uniref:Uncharacterized protein n=1 Tax=Aspergillus kawachii TaxID=1069201 RepID=A0A7R7W459_ASPKA|nr:uncharacterized protein AKAW2_20982A [Aspergillus luchuensis]BCR96042.1 hypothetical protein AKAW2_20982A [Aspergillus luchuensis]
MYLQLTIPVDKRKKTQELLISETHTHAFLPQLHYIHPSIHELPMNILGHRPKSSTYNNNKYETCRNTRNTISLSSRPCVAPQGYYEEDYTEGTDSYYVDRL